MAQQASVRLQLNSGDAAMKLERFAMDSATVRSAWGALPADLRYAQSEMVKLGAQQIRMGHLRRSERQHLAQYQDRQLQHQHRLAQATRTLETRIGRNPHLARYRQLEAGGGLGGAVRSDGSIAALHAQMQQLQGFEGQQGAIASTNALLGQYGTSSAFNAGNAASYWGRRAAFGSGPGGAPRTAGQWASNAIVGGARRTKRRVGQVAGMFAAFQGMQLLTQSMSAFERKAMTVQEIGSKLGSTVAGMGDAFAYVENVISGTKGSGRGGIAHRLGFATTGGQIRRGGLRRDYGYTLSQLAPGLGQMAKYTGSLSAAEGAVRFARALGLGPSETMGAFAQTSQYGPLDYGRVERGIHGMGMGNRPELYLNWLTSTRSTLGAGVYQTGDQALRYMGLVSSAGGDAYRNQRGIDLTGRLIGGVKASGGGALFAAKMAAVSGMGRVDLGGGRYADTSTYRGMRAALESGDPEVLKRLFAESQRLGGTGSGSVGFQREIFQGMLSGSLNVHESDMIFDQLQKGGPLKVPSGDNLDGRLDRVRSKNNLAWRIQQSAAEMEVDVYEKVGEVLRPIAVDFKDAALLFAERVTHAGDALSFASEMMNGVSNAMEHLRSENVSPVSRAMFEASMLNADSGFGSFLKYVGSWVMTANGALNR